MDALGICFKLKLKENICNTFGLSENWFKELYSLIARLVKVSDAG